MNAVVYEILLWHVPMILFGAFCLFAMGFRLGQRCEILEEAKRAKLKNEAFNYLYNSGENQD